MTSQAGFDPRMNPGAGVGGAPRATFSDGLPDAVVLHAVPVEEGRADPPPPTGSPYHVSGSGQDAQGASAEQTGRRSGTTMGGQADFERLCRDIGQGVSQVSDALAKGLSGATDALGGAIGQAMEGYRQSQARAQEQAELARQQALVDARYARASSLRAGAIVRSVFGGIFTFAFGLGLISVLPSIDEVGVFPWLVGTVATGALFAGSLALLLSGTKRLKLARQLEAIKRIAGPREVIPIHEIARATGQDQKRTAAGAQALIAKGCLPEGHLDDMRATLMVTTDAYQRYRALEEEKRAKADPPPPVGKPVMSDEAASPKVRRFLDEGGAYLKRFHELDVDIADEAVSQRIERIEEVVGRILARAKDEPRVIDQLGRFADYYLPTTVKLLEAYDALEEHAVQGQNIESSRREIESTLDVLLQAYEKLLDATFADLSLDVSSEISVLNTVLAQEGLTRSPFDERPQDDPMKG